MTTQTFVFILTDGTGKKRFGTCRRFLPFGAGARFPCSIVLVTTERPEQGLLEQLLRVAENKIAFGALGACVPLLEAAAAATLPKTSGAAASEVVVIVSQLEEYRFLRPQERDNAFEQLVPLLHRVGSRNLVRLFAHLLFERRLIFCAASLQVLSTGVQSTLALLYPFVWQHVLVPVLPEALLNFCCAPMPFVIGILSHQLAEMQTLRHAMEDVVIFDLDNDAFLEDEHNNAPLKDYEAIPEAYRTAILHQVDAAKRAERNGSAKQGKMLGRPFLAFFVQMFWNYKRFFSGAGGFDRAGFLESKSSPASRSFLAEFVETQMVCQFFQEYQQHGDGLAQRFAAFDRLTNYVEMQFQAAVRELENSNPRERFKRRMSRILPFGAVRKSAYDLRATNSSSNVLQLSEGPLSPSKQFSRELNGDLEIVKKRDQVSGFGLPLSTMSRKAAPPVAIVPAAAMATQNASPADDFSPFKIRGQIEPGHSPNIFSPSCEADEEFDGSSERGADELMRSVGQAERFLSQFFEASAIERANDTTSFATVDDHDGDSACEGTLQEDMVALARLIQESWTEFGEDAQPTVLSPSSPYHNNVCYERYGLTL